MEYLSSGKVIVSTRVAEYVHTPELVVMPSENKLFAGCLGAVASNLAEWNSEANRQRRKAYAAANAYPKLVDKIRTLLTENA